MSENTYTPPDRLLDTADALIDILLESPGITIDQLLDTPNRPKGSFQDRVFARTSDEEIIEATRFLARCGVIAMERRKLSSPD